MLMFLSQGPGLHLQLTPAAEQHHLPQQVEPSLLLLPRLPLLAAPLPLLAPLLQQQPMKQRLLRWQPLQLQPAWPSVHYGCLAVRQV
jgi:hypothetical protein